RGGAGAVRHVDRASHGGGEPLSVQVGARVRPNAAAAHNARLIEAIAARDEGAGAAPGADRSGGVDPTPRRTSDREGLLATLRPLGRAQDGTMTIRIEGLATLGESLGLGRQTVSASGVRARTFDVGPYEIEAVMLIEVDGEGRRTRSEIFAPNRLGDAVPRLYERSSQLLPTGPARARAPAAARPRPAAY